MYYQQIVADPKMPDRSMSDGSDAGVRGRRPHVEPAGERNKHVDNHYVWIDPDEHRPLLVGCDGGLYETWDRGQLWRSCRTCR